MLIPNQANHGCARREAESEAPCSTVRGLLHLCYFQDRDLSAAKTCCRSLGRRRVRGRGGPWKQVHRSVPISTSSAAPQQFRKLSPAASIRCQNRQVFVQHLFGVIQSTVNSLLVSGYQGISHIVSLFTCVQTLSTYNRNNRRNVT